MYRFLWFFKDFIYLFRETQRQAEIGRGRSRLPAGKPDAGLDSRTPGLRPEPKADAQPLSHPGAPGVFFGRLLNTGSASEGKADFKSRSRRTQRRRKTGLINDRVAGAGLRSQGWIL